MSRTRSRSFPSLLLVPVALTLTVAAGCGVSKDDEPSSSETTSASPEPSVSETPTQTVTETVTPSASPTPSAPTPSLTPEASLLTVAEFPSLNDTVRWKQVRTGPVNSQSFGLCAKFDVLSVGAEQAVERTFAAGAQGTASSDTAAEQVAVFPDATNTARATKVLQSWHATCAQRVKGSKVKVGAITPVPVAQGTGWWYLVSYVKGGQGHFHSFGVVVAGNRIALLRTDVTGEDHNYEPGQDPMQLAVKAAAGKLG